jgi:C-terminal processing protease CtpA/Prc
MSFRGFLAGSAESDSLNQKLLASRKELTELRRREESRVRQIRAAIQGDPREYLEADEILQGLRAKEAELVATQEELAQRLMQVREAQVQSQWAEVRARTNEAYAEAQRERALAAERWASQDPERNRQAEEVWRRSLEQYRSPIFIGQDVVWGAELKPLTEAQAEVLAADGGILVVQVPEGTPAAEVGLQDLDVIVSVAGEEVQSLGDLRLSLELYEGPLVLRVIRKGEPVEIRIRR